MTAGLVVVGGGPAGHSAAAAYRSAGGEGPVRVISADQEAPYNRPPLSKDFLRGESGEDELPLEAASFYADHDIKLMLARRVDGLDAQGRTVTLESGESIAFDACVVATGSRPAALPVPGGDHPDVLRLRFLQQARTLRAAAEQAAAAVVVGSGFIGCEAAASLAMRGLAVTVVSAEELPQLERLGRDAAERIAGWLRDHGVRLVGGVGVESISEGRRVNVADGSHHDGDLVLTAVSIEPQSGLAHHAGLEVHAGRVVVDEQMRTSMPGVFAAGDVALARNGAAGRHLSVEHWGEAMAMGEVAGTVAAHRDAAWAEVPGFWSEIGERSLKYAAWGDGFDESRLVDHGAGAFTIWYGTRGVCVGVLTHESDADYDRGSALIRRAQLLP